MVLDTDVLSNPERGQWMSRDVVAIRSFLRLQLGALVTFVRTLLPGVGEVLVVNRYRCAKRVAVENSGTLGHGRIHTDPAGRRWARGARYSWPSRDSAQWSTLGGYITSSSRNFSADNPGSSVVVKSM